MLCFRLSLIADKDHLRRSVVSLECPFSHRHVESAAMQQASHSEHHYIHRIGWIRAAVLGANDGILSIASLLMGVAAATQDQTTLMVSGIAGLTAGAFSMAAGEFVSVSSQADIERADLAIERRAIARVWKVFSLQKATKLARAPHQAAVTVITRVAQKT